MSDNESMGTEEIGTGENPSNGPEAGNFAATIEDMAPPPSAPRVSGSDEPQPSHSASELQAVFDIPVQVQAVLGRASMQVGQLLKLGRGAVVELDRKVGEAIDIYVNNRLVARGEVVVVDEKLGVTMTEIVKSDHN